MRREREKRDDREDEAQDWENGFVFLHNKPPLALSLLKGTFSFLLEAGGRVLSEL